MTDKRRQAFIAWASKVDGFRPEVQFGDDFDHSYTSVAWMAWQAACEWMAQPPQPTEGALVLDGEFFKRK